MMTGEVPISSEYLQTYNHGDHGTWVNIIVRIQKWILLIRRTKGPSRIFYTLNRSASDLASANVTTLSSLH